MVSDKLQTLAGLLAVDQHFFLTEKVQTITLEKHIIQAISSTFTGAHSSSG